MIVVILEGHHTQANNNIIVLNFNTFSFQGINIKEKYLFILPIYFILLPYYLFILFFVNLIYQFLNYYIFIYLFLLFY